MPSGYEADTQIKVRPLLFVDLEFSGLAADHEILQIGCVTVKQPDFSVVSEWSTKVQPSHIENADPVALKIIGYDEAAWTDAVPLREALLKFNEIAKDKILIGFNVVGDFFQLKKSFHQVNLEPAYHWQVLDVQSMVFAALYNEQMTGYRMREVVARYGIQEGKWHDALVDARATYEIFKKIMANR